MKYKKKLIIYAFIDSQNLNLGTSKNLYKNKKLIYRGWKLDFKKFYLYLRNKFKVSKTFLFIGYIKQNQNKPTTKDHQGKFYDQAIIVAGDGDYIIKSFYTGKKIT